MLYHRLLDGLAKVYHFEVSSLIEQDALLCPLRWVILFPIVAEEYSLGAFQMGSLLRRNCNISLHWLLNRCAVLFLHLFRDFLVSNDSFF